MASFDLPRSPNVFHPEKPSAVGSRNSLAQDYRDQQKEVNQLLEEETNKVLHHMNAKLPKEVLERLDVMGGVKEKLYNYFNQNYQNMFNRYMVTAEDEMLKKVRGFIDREEMKVLNRYTPKEIANLLDEVGGADKFNTGEIEKSMVNMYGHLQGHIQRGVNDLETLTNSLLRQKTDVGAFVRGENAYSIVKCAFKDNIYKPKTVTDVKLSVNILDSELISPIFQYQATVEYLIKDLLSNHYMDQIDKIIEKMKDDRIDKGMEELSDGEIIFAKMNNVPNFTDDDVENPKSRRYSIMAKEMIAMILAGGQGSRLYALTQKLAKPAVDHIPYFMTDGCKPYRTVLLERYGMYVIGNRGRGRPGADRLVPSDRLNYAIVEKTREGRRLRKVRRYDVHGHVPDDLMNTSAIERRNLTIRLLSSRARRRTVTFGKGGRPGLPRTAEGELQPVHAALFTLPSQKGE